MELDLLSLDSVARFAEAWNARMGPLHVLINNAGIFSIGGSYFKCNSFFSHSMFPFSAICSSEQ
jgi:NAD(P)-dependent dehydrogenase (short-subunit alcohol dehydrogenase family)